MQEAYDHLTAGLTLATVGAFGVLVYTAVKGWRRISEYDKELSKGLENLRTHCREFQTSLNGTSQVIGDTNREIREASGELEAQIFQMKSEIGRLGELQRELHIVGKDLDLLGAYLNDSSIPSVVLRTYVDMGKL